MSHRDIKPENIAYGEPFLVPSPAAIERDANRGGGNARQRRRRRRVALRGQWVGRVEPGAPGESQGFTWTDCEVTEVDWRRVYDDAMRMGSVMPYKVSDPSAEVDPVGAEDEADLLPEIGAKIRDGKLAICPECRGVESYWRVCGRCMGLGLVQAVPPPTS